MVQYVVSYDTDLPPGQQFPQGARDEIEELMSSLIDAGAVVEWGDVSNKPAVIAAGTTQAAARTAIDVPSNAQLTSAVQAAKDSLLNGAGSAYDTFKELQDLFAADDIEFAALVTETRKSPLGARMPRPVGIGYPNLSVSVDTTAPSYFADKSISWTSTVGTKFRVGGVLSDYAGNGQNNINGATAATLAGWTSYDYEFYFRGRYLDVYTYVDQISDFRVIVDDVWATSKWQTFPTAGTAFHLKLDFGSATDIRKIRLLMPGCALVQSFRMETTSDMWAAEPRFRAAVIGDSYVQGPTSTSEGALYGGNVAGDLAAKTGWEVWNMGQGGTGRLFNGGGGSGISQYASAGRMAALAALPALDLIIDYGGANDSGLTEATVVTASTAHWNALKAARPTTPLIVVGPEPGTLSGFSAPAMNSLNTALKTAALANTNVAAYIDQRTVTWVTGTGKNGTPANDGNADFFMSSDGIHPSHAGFDNITNRLVRELRGVRV